MKTRKTRLYRSRDSAPSFVYSNIAINIFLTCYFFCRYLTPRKCKRKTKNRSRNRPVLTYLWIFPGKQMRDSAHDVYRNTKTSINIFLTPYFCCIYLYVIKNKRTAKNWIRNGPLLVSLCMFLGKRTHKCSASCTPQTSY